MMGEILVHPTFDQLAPMRAQLTAMLEPEHALKTERLQDLRLAVSEATTNAIEAHGRAKTEVPVKVSVSITKNNVVVKITDRGTGFDPSKLTAHPPVTDPKRLEYERGLGVSLMRTLTDGCDISSNAKGTTVTLTMLR